jgi:hypothetical protein
MGQNFFPDTVNQTLLFPPSLHEWLPDGHLARFLVDVVAALNLNAIYAFYTEKDGRGQPVSLGPAPAAHCKACLVVSLNGKANGQARST